MSLNQEVLDLFNPPYKDKVAEFFSKSNAKRNRLADYLNEDPSYIKAVQFRSNQITPYEEGTIKTKAYVEIIDDRQDIVKWAAVYGRHAIPKDASVVIIGVGNGHLPILIKMLGVDKVVGFDSHQIFMTKCALAMAENDVEFDLYKSEKKAITAAIKKADWVLFSRAFNVDGEAQENIQHIKDAVDAGKRVIVSSTSLYTGTNEFGSIEDPYVMTHLLELPWENVLTVFEVTRRA